MDRRDFIKISSVLTAGSTVLTSCGKALRQALPQVVPEDQLVIGEERRLKSVCTGCGGGCGVEVRWVDGRAVKLEGLAGHPVNNGRLCARGQAELQALYNPDRVRTPLYQGQEIPWDKALDLLAEKLRSADLRRIAFVTGRLRGLRRKLVDGFLAALGAPPRVELEPLSDAIVREAYRRTTGYHALPAPDFFNSNYVLSFGAPLVEAGPSPVLAQRGLGHMRQGRPGRRGKLVQIESRYSLTAAYADEWVPIAPGTEGALALAIAQVLGRSSGFSPETAAAVTGVDAKRIERLAREFGDYKPAVALIGGAAAGYSNSLAAAEAVAALNALNGGFGVAGGIFFDVEDTAENGKAQARMPVPQVLLVAGSNPLYEFPGLLPKAEFLVSFASFPDETAVAAQLVLPNHTTLESWQETAPEAAGLKVRSVARPAVEPLYQTRDTADVLLDLWMRLGKKPSAESWKDMIAASFASEDEFNAALERGGEWSAERPKFEFRTRNRKFEFGQTRWEPPRFAGDGEFFLQIYTGVALGAGEGASIPWLQELPDPLSQTVWASSVEMNPKTAARLGVEEGEWVWVESPRGRARARVAISPAAPPGVVSMAAGQGHAAFGRYARGRGANVFELVDPANWAATKVRIRKV